MRTLFLSLALFATPALAGDVYHRTSENGVAVYRGVVKHPDVNAILATQAYKARIEADAQARETAARAEAERRDLLLRQTEALEDIATAIEDLDTHRGYGRYGYGFGGFSLNTGFGGIFTDSFPQTGGRVRLFAPGPLRPRVVPGSGNVRY